LGSSLSSILSMMSSNMHAIDGTNVDSARMSCNSTT
jgi:hypothetical protein